MIEKEQLFCTVQNETVDALVEVRKNGRGKSATADRVPVTCMNSMKCSGVSHCRFVNPLSTRNPLQPADKQEASVS